MIWSILAIDLAKAKSLFCRYEADQSHRLKTTAIDAGRRHRRASPAAL